MSKYKSFLMDREQELDGEIYILKKKEYKVARLFKKLMPSTWSYNYWMSVGVKLNKSIKRLQREKTNISY